MCEAKESICENEKVRCEAKESICEIEVFPVRFRLLSV